MSHQKMAASPAMRITDRSNEYSLATGHATAGSETRTPVPEHLRRCDRRRQDTAALGLSVSAERRVAEPDFREDAGGSVVSFSKDLPSKHLRRSLVTDASGVVRDCVDAPLANLFVHAARTVAPDAEGANRARSASEAFLYRRLETLPETDGRFRLNADLPIPFDGWGKMEVDLLCASARVAVELDGGQHLADADAYRRDRRKDSLLQENGYFVLRFLAEDVGKNLDEVLDAILRTLSRRGRKQVWPG